MSTASTNALGSLLSSLNNGNAGIDVTSAVASIIAAERAPEQAWQAQQAALNNQASALQKLDSDASSITDALQSLTDVGGAFSSIQATSSNSSVVIASAQPGTTAGTHTVVVNNLASTASWYSAEESSSSASLPNGTVQITVGGNATTFKTGASGSGNLDQLASAINGAGLGVNASIISDINGSRLALVAQNSGSAADFSVSNKGGFAFTRSVTGQDASITLDGVPVSSNTNLIAGAIPGLTLNLQSVSASPVTIGLAPDASAIQSALASFVSAYNSLITDLKSQFTYNASTTSEGVLGADSVARSLQTDILGAANLSIGSGAYTTLTSLGITTKQDGTLSLDTTQLASAVSTNFQSVVNFFQGVDGAPGFATNVTTTLNTYTDTTQGAFTIDLNSISSEYQDLASQISTFEIYIAKQQTLLTAQYNSANIALQQLPQQIKQVQALLGTDGSGSK